eukprot:SAG11_NODE_11075_length_785_cov_1.192420_1_plen_65_part_00
MRGHRERLAHLTIGAIENRLAPLKYAMELVTLYGDRSECTKESLPMRAGASNLCRRVCTDHHMN